MQKRGWCSYTELSCLMNHAQLLAFARTTMFFSSICLALYIVGVMMLLGFMYLAAQSISSSGMLLNVEFARQPMCSRSAFSTESVVLNSSVVVQSHKMDNEIPIVDSYFIRDEIDKLNCSSITISNDDAISWQWWLNSTMTWLPEYCGLKSDIITSGVTESTNALFMSDNKFSLNLMQVEGRNRIINFMLDNYHRYYKNFNETSNVTNRMAQYWKEPHKIVTRSLILF